MCTYYFLIIFKTAYSKTLFLCVWVWYTLLPCHSTALLAYLTVRKLRRSVEFSTPPLFPYVYSALRRVLNELFGLPGFWSRPALCYSLVFLLLCFDLMLTFCFPWGLLDDDDDDDLDVGVVMWPYCCFSECFLFVFWRDSPPVGQDFLIHEVSRSHTMAHHSR